ncbi:hypothetical protein ACTXT7_016422 [Hymenolepis weldensis]
MAWPTMLINVGHNANFTVLLISVRDVSISSNQGDKSFGETTPVKQVPTSQLQAGGSIPAQQFSLMSLISASAKRKYSGTEANLVSPFGIPYCTSSPRCPLSVVSTSTTNADGSEFDFDNDDDIERDIIIRPSQRGGEPEEDSALVTSPTSYSLLSHESSDQEEEMAEDCDTDLMATIYLGSDAKKQGCLCRSLPVLSDRSNIDLEDGTVIDDGLTTLDVYKILSVKNGSYKLQSNSLYSLGKSRSVTNNASGGAGCGWSVLKETLKKPSFDSRSLLVDTTMDEAYVPITTISSNDGDACELEDDDNEDPTMNTRLGDTTSNNRCPLADWSMLSYRSEDLANLAAALRLSPTDSTKLHKVFQDGSKLIEWLSSLETEVYSSTPSKSLSISSSKPLCRLRSGLTRENWNRYLHDLESNLGKVQSWRQKVDTLFIKHQKRFAGFENQSGKLLASDHGLLVFLPSWLDTIASRCSEVKRELRSQLRLSDYLTTISDERKKKLQKVKDRAEPVLTEADYLVDKLGGSSGSITDVSHVNQDLLAINAVTEKLQELLERASELDSSYGLGHRDSIESLTDNQILRARLRNALANLQILHPRIVSLSLSVSTPSRRCTGRQILMFTILALFSVFILGFVQVVWLNKEEILFHRACENRKWVLCIASVWSHSLCVLLHTVLPSLEPPYDFSNMPPI